MLNLAFASLDHEFFVEPLETLEEEAMPDL